MQLLQQTARLETGWVVTDNENCQLSTDERDVRLSQQFLDADISAQKVSGFATQPQVCSGLREEAMFASKQALPASLEPDAKRVPSASVASVASAPRPHGC